MLNVGDNSVGGKDVKNFRAWSLGVLLDEYADGGRDWVSSAVHRALS